MKPAPFEYLAPGDLPTVLGLLRDHGEEAKPLDVNLVPGLAYIDRSDGELIVGALTRHADLERSAVVRAELRCWPRRCR